MGGVVVVVVGLGVVVVAGALGAVVLG